jgi:glycosyltransferase involved in cell wall biosynthesis
MFKAVMISPLPPQKTGESQYTKRLIHSLIQESKIHITAITGKKAHPIMDDENISTLRIWQGNRSWYPFVLLRKIKRIRPHIVHVQFGPHSKIYGGLFGEPMLILLLFLRLIGVKTTVTLHSTWMPSQAKERIRQYRNLKRFAIMVPSIFRLYIRLLGWVSNTLQLSTVKMDSKLRTVFLQEYDVNPSKVLEIPHPCTPVRNKETILSINEERKIVLIFGFIRKGKGFEVAIQALSILRNRFPTLFLTIAGQAQDNESKQYLVELDNMIQQLSLQENVRIDNRFIPEDQTKQYIRSASILLVPYTESIGASAPIHNFAAYGVPIVASDVGYHMKETLGGSLLLFQNGNPKDLAKQLSRLLSDENLAQEIGSKHAEYARKSTWENAAKITLRNYWITMQI